jgi:antitoxin component YwqK of YwqJK toxin-antitoxin module
MKKCIPVLILLLVSSLYPQVNIDIDKLLERGGLLYAPNKEKPFTGSVFDLFDNGQYKLKGRYRSGLKHGKWTWWNYNGEKRKEVIWQNGKEISTKEWEYFKNGLKSNERKYKDGEKDGKWIKWYANGQKESEENYKVGVIDDEWIEWYENGQKKIEKKYKNGEPNGDWTEWNIDGQKEVEAFFKGGNRDRSWTWWYENGQIRQEVTYKDDEIIGVWTSWDEKGIIVWEGTIEEYEAEEARKAEIVRLAEEARIAAKEKARKEKEFRQAESMRLAAEKEARKAEVARLAEEGRLAEEARLVEEARKAEKTRIAALDLSISVSTTIPLPDESIKIQWNKPTPVKIYYIIDRQRTMIHHSNANVQIYFWRIPKILEGKRFSIEVEEVGNEKNKDTINLFVRVTSKPLLTKKESNLKSKTDQLSLKVGTTRPSVDERISLQWNIFKPVKVSYRSYGQRIHIFTSTENVQTYFWKIPKILAGNTIDVKVEEIGNENNYDIKYLFVQSSSTSSLVKGSTSKTNIKKQKQQSNGYLKNIFVSSNEKILIENGYYFSFNFPNITFNNSVFKKKIKDETIKRSFAGGFGFEYKESPHIFSTEANIVSFETVLDTNIIYFTSIDANYRYSLLNINNVVPSVGFGYQGSEISILNYGEYSSLETSGFYLIGDIKFGFATKNADGDMNGAGIGANLKRSINLKNLDLDWEQSSIYFYLFGAWAFLPCGLLLVMLGL